MKKIKIIITLFAVIIFLLNILFAWGGCDIIENKLAPQKINIIGYKDNILKKTFKLQGLEAIRMQSKPEYENNIFLGIAKSKSGDRYFLYRIDENYILIHMQNRAIYTFPKKSIQVLKPFLHERELYIKKILKEYENESGVK